MPGAPPANLLPDVYRGVHVLSQAKPLKKPKKAAGELDEDDKAFFEKKKAEQVPPQDVARTVHRACSSLQTKESCFCYLRLCLLTVQAALKQLKEKAAGKGGFAKATNVTGKKK